MPSRQVTQIRSEYVASREIYEKVQRKRKKGLIRRLIAFFILMGFVTFGMLHVLNNQSHKLKEMEAEKAHLQKQLNATKEEQSQLKQQIERLNDDEYLGKLARKNFFMSKDGEIIFTTPKSDEH
ncbi:MAG: FtsB family cell division protein [Tuberibacillus sp.]